MISSMMDHTTISWDAGALRWRGLRRQPELSWRVGAESRCAAGGRRSAPGHHRQRFDEIGEVWRRRHLHGDGAIESDTQAIYGLAWHAGLIPQSLKQLTAAAFKASMARRDNRVYSGILGTIFLLNALISP